MLAMRFRDLLLDRWWIVVVSIVCVGLGGVGVTLFTPPIYQATALVQVDIPSTDPTVLVGVTRIVYTQAQLATSAPVFADVIGRHSGLTQARLASEVTASPVANANLVQIAVRDQSPSFAATIADEVARTLISQQAEALRKNNSAAQQPLQDAVTATSSNIVSTTAEINRLTATRGDPNQIASLRTKLDALNAQLAQQQATLSALQVDQAKKSIYMHLAQTARVASNPVRASYLLNIGGSLVFGLLLGICAILLQDLLSQRMRNAQGIEDLIELPVLAELAPSALADQPVRALATRALSGEGFERLTTALTFLGVDHPLRFIAITSIKAQPATSELAAALAIISASKGQRTLLVDGDLAHSSQQRRFDLAQENGVSDAILAFRSPKTPRDEVERYGGSPRALDLPTLRVLPGGTKPPNVAGLLASRAAGNLFAALDSSSAQSVIMNAPSVMGRAGALGLCARADGVILLIDITTARRYAIIEARARLREAGVKLLGCVVIQQTKRQAQQQGSDRRQRVRAPHDVSAQPTIKQGAVERVRFSTSQTP